MNAEAYRSVRVGSRHILLQGLALIFTGLAWGFVVPATPYPRLALSAHIQFIMGGMLAILMAVLVLTLPNRVGYRSIWVMGLSAWLTWPMALSEAANAWWGTNRMLPIVASQAGARGGEPWQELILHTTHISAGLALLLAWVLLIVGFARTPRAVEKM